MTEQMPKQTLTIGDRVRLKSRMANEYLSMRDANGEMASAREPMEGMVFSIRDVATGRLVAEATGDLTQYVIEIVYDHTFNARYASLRNAPRGSDSIYGTPGWKKMQAALRAAAQKGELFATGMMKAADPTILSLLDGWKVVKIWSKDIVNLQKPEPVQEAVAG